jgi:hypothetical protein
VIEEVWMCGSDGLIKLWMCCGVYNSLGISGIKLLYLRQEERKAARRGERVKRIYIVRIL